MATPLLAALTLTLHKIRSKGDRNKTIKTNMKNSGRRVRCESTGESNAPTTHDGDVSVPLMRRTRASRKSGAISAICVLGLAASCLFITDVKQGPLLIIIPSSTTLQGERESMHMKDDLEHSQENIETSPRDLEMHGVSGKEPPTLLSMKDELEAEALDNGPRKLSSMRDELEAGAFDMRTDLVKGEDGELQMEAAMAEADRVQDSQVFVSNVELPSFIQENVANIDSPLLPRQMETPLFWHVPKAGGTAIQHLYWCMGLILANEVGANPKFKKHDTNELLAFRPWKNMQHTVVNVDTTTEKGLRRAREMKLLGDHDETLDYTDVDNFDKDTLPETELVLTGELLLSAELLYSPQHKARVFGLFRHPVHRAASMFYYLRKATWEPTYNPAYNKMTLVDYAQTTGGDNNYMVRKLVGKKFIETVDDYDLEQAKKTVKEKMIVGIMDEFEESVHRFNAVMGVDTSLPENAECFEKFAAQEQKNTLEERKDANREFARDKRQNAAKKRRQANPDGKNSNAHPEVNERSPAWQNIVDNNVYDVKLYSYVRKIFDEQRVLFELGGVYYRKSDDSMMLLGET